MNVYEIVNQKILDELEKGVIPWRKPWNTPNGHLPMNLISGKQYRGINLFLLSLDNRFTSEYWLTYKQATDRGGNVKKGEKSTIVVFWKLQEKENQETGKKDHYPVLRYYKVFNVEQCEGVDYPKAAEIETQIFTPIERCEKVLKGYSHGPNISLGGTQAYYSPLSDSIQVPKPEYFKSAESFYSTMFHEMTHSTRHESRLNRKFDDDSGVHYFGDPNYSKEELVAEFGSAFLCGHTGIENQTVQNSAAYIDSWRKVLKASPKILVMAAAKAQKAADYILGITE